MAGNARNYGPIQTFKAGAAIEANRAIKLDSTVNTVIHTTAITNVVVGISLTKVAADEYVDVLTMPGAKGKLRLGAGGATLGAELMPEASGDGDVVVAAGATALGCAVALQAGSEGETIEVLFRPGIKSPANS